MIQLAVDTATERAVIALYSGDLLIGYEHFEKGFDHARVIEEKVKTLMQKHGVSCRDLHFLTCGVGPGSYTGIRVGVSFCMGISFACSIPVVPISTLELFTDETRPFYVVLDARISGVYLMKSSSKVPELVTFDQFIDQLPEGISIITANKEPLLKRYDFPKNEIIEKVPDLSVLGSRGFEKFQNGEAVFDKLEILYLRKTEAEERSGL